LKIVFVYSSALMYAKRFGAVTMTTLCSAERSRVHLLTGQTAEKAWCVIRIIILSVFHCCSIILSFYCV